MNPLLNDVPSNNPEAPAAQPQVKKIFKPVEILTSKGSLLEMKPVSGSSYVHPKTGDAMMKITNDDGTLSWAIKVEDFATQAQEAKTVERVTDDALFALLQQSGIEGY